MADLKKRNHTTTATMGNILRSSRTTTAKNKQGSNSLFDFAGMLIAGKIPEPTSIPSSLDELVDWTEEATARAGRLFLASQDCSVVLPDWSKSKESIALFKPFIRRSVLDKDKMMSMYHHQQNNKENVVAVTANQTHILHFPCQNAIEIAEFYNDNVLISVESNHENRTLVHCTLSVEDFCSYMILLRRISELKEVQDQAQLSKGTAAVEEEEEDDEVNDNYENSNDNHEQVGDQQVVNKEEEKQYDAAFLLSCHDDCEILDKECRICMSSSQEVVLPCMHGFCEDCAQRWVYKRLDCPFCRRQFSSLRRLRKEQWEIETWTSDSDIQKDITDLEDRMKLFWSSRQHVKNEEFNNHNDEETQFLRITVSVHDFEVEDDMVAIT